MKISLNLIPPQKKEEIAMASRFKVFLKWGSEFFIIFAVFMAMLVSINYILEINLSFVSGSSNESEKSNNQYAEIKKYDAEIKNMNSRILEIEKIQKGQLRWSAFFQKLNSQVPGGIELENLATKSYAISLAGRAQARNELISFKENLEKEECFTDINLPLSNLVSKENIAFQIDFRIKQECIK